MPPVIDGTRPKRHIRIASEETPRKFQLSDRGTNSRTTPSGGPTAAVKRMICQAGGFNRVTAQLSRVVTVVCRLDGWQ